MALFFGQNEHIAFGPDVYVDTWRLECLRTTCSQHLDLELTVELADLINDDAHVIDRFKVAL